MGELADEHGNYEELAVAHVMGGLPDRDAPLFRAHLLECPRCRARVGELRAIAHDLADVERDERRERAAETVATAQHAAVSSEPTSSMRGGWGIAVLGLLAVLIIMALSAWTFVLRGNLDQLERAVEARLAAALIIELGTQVEPVLVADGVDASVKVRGGQLAVIADGLEFGDYGVFLVSNRAEGEVVHYRELHHVTDGRLVDVVDLMGTEDRLVVTMPSAMTAPGPSGRQVLSVALHRAGETGDADEAGETGDADEADEADEAGEADD